LTTERRATNEFEIDTGLGSMTCGYCHQFVAWPQAIGANVTLTGFHTLGVHEETNQLVVMAEASDRSGGIVHLPHHCLCIPESLHRDYAPDTVLAREEQVTA
jgi:hypothetical protein